MSDQTGDTTRGARRLGFGVSGPHGSPLVRPEATVRMIERAVALGVQVFDTAPSYGGGEAERRLGEAIRRMPACNAIISTKAGILASGLKHRHRDFSPTGVRRSVEASLRRLGCGRIDWLFLHGPSEAELTDELLTTLVDLKFSGDIRAIGICGRGPELDAALASGQFSHFMAPVHAGLPLPDVERLIRLRSAGELIGIETLAGISASPALPLSAGQIWRLAQRVGGRRMRQPAQPLTVAEAISWSLGDGRAHRIITTTTLMAHLESNVATAINGSAGPLISDASGPSSHG